jgi:hypothetical protein
VLSEAFLGKICETLSDEIGCVQGGMAVDVRPYLKNNLKVKRAGGLAQAVENFPNKHKALNSKASTIEKKKKERKKKTQNDKCLCGARKLYTLLVGM